MVFLQIIKIYTKNKVKACHILKIGDNYQIMYSQLSQVECIHFLNCQNVVSLKFNYKWLSSKYLYANVQ